MKPVRLRFFLSLPCIAAATVLSACNQEEHTDRRSTRGAAPSQAQSAGADFGIVGGVLAPAGDQITTSTVTILQQLFEPGAYTYRSCSGTLLDNQFVLTAAHCVSNFGPYQSVKVFVLFGASVDYAGFLKSGYTSMPYREVVGFRPHPAFNPATAQNDIGLAQFTGGIPAGYAPVRIGAERPSLGDWVMMAGYGYTGWVSGDAGTLRYTTTAVTGVSDDHSFATQTAGHTNCSGDSGGPVFAQVDGNDLQVGVVSNTGDTCASIGGSISVADFIPWLREQEAAPNILPTKPCGVLATGQRLLKGASLRSCDGRYVLALQDDGNLVVYQGSKPLWHTATYGRPEINEAVLQNDGNFVLYKAGGGAAWSTGTGVSTTGTYVMRLQDDGNLVIYKQISPSNAPATWSRLRGVVNQI